jgi:hypothetical protein
MSGTFSGDSDVPNVPFLNAIDQFRNCRPENRAGRGIPLGRCDTIKLDFDMDDGGGVA